ncbi:shikimate dehydrogenase family protein [Tessaracoccus caeni]|uniref:shikimate dehydrogenase family protein n=1 Tax=Tessaracoccus caeni TaxID=3031239 RepID=UPI0023D9F67B|nr:shikimate dehydrogenase [Tessaracoccus caeni]MDF1490284.1 shikimate dehydrogenase [Tessaracoccus caeni]
MLREQGSGTLLSTPSRRVAVIGDPAEHSLSPSIHRAGYEAVGLKWRYDAITVSSEELDGFIASVKADPAWAGLSVTAPHKAALLEHGEPDQLARLVGGGNTLVLAESGATVHNTDVPGFVRAWRAHGLEAPKVAAIVGNGATARSLLVALAGLDTREVLVLARVPERAASLVELGNALGITVTPELIDQEVAGIDLLASTVPTAATAPHAERWAKHSAVIFDAVYDPWPTPLGEAAAVAGRMSLNGLDLLAGQAVDQFFLLTGKPITFELARSAAGRELKRRAKL